LHYINDKRINQADVLQILERGVCFDDEERYADLLDEVSKSSLKYHEALNHGLLFMIQKDEDYRNPYVMKLNMKRDKNGYALESEGKTFKLTNSNKLMDWSSVGNKRNETHFYELWDRIKSVITINDDELAALFKEGVKEQKRAEEKAEALLQKTIKSLGVEKCELEVGGRMEKGYKIKGKMRTYFLCETLGVYNYNTKQYVCIVDRTHSMRVHKDKLVNRMFALKNDSLLTAEIHTLAQ
jgi:hypothetical protein